MKIDAEWVRQKATRRVMEALGEAWFVGGCVRNALMGVPVADIDIATALVPDEVARRAVAAGLHVVPTGIAHGTVTLASLGVPHEVTTFRRDVSTDGRRASIAFATDMAEDAARRDFTINALYADADGTVIDPLGGLDDVFARRVRFVGEAAARIREDYLRILRFFRFAAVYAADKPLDPTALAAIKDNAGGLKQLSAERVTSELLKLLDAPDPERALTAMDAIGVLDLTLPGTDLSHLSSLLNLERANHAPPDPLRRLAAIVGEVSQLRLSKKQAETFAILKTGQLCADN
ncbi:MAG: CCA tRNA nucleotidyltransferase, partial [Deltaproteobacteria bacterium]